MLFCLGVLGIGHFCFRWVMSLLLWHVRRIISNCEDGNVDLRIPIPLLFDRAADGWILRLIDMLIEDYNLLHANEDRKLLIVQVFYRTVH